MHNYMEPEGKTINWDAMDEKKYCKHIAQIDWKEVEEFNILYICLQADLME